MDISNFERDRVSVCSEAQPESVQNGILRRSMRLLPSLAMRDFIGRATLTFYFAFGAAIKVGALILALRHIVWTTASSIDFAADVASLGFLALMAVSTVTRLPPMKTAQGIEPRIAALLGCFATVTLIVVPRVEILPQLKLFADLIILGGFTLCIWCLWWLGRSFSIVAQARRLVTAGPYRFVRHPLYACEAIVLIGILLRNPTWGTVAICAIALTFQYRRLVNEEKVLQAAFPEYAAYKLVTPMLFPALFR
ncbi:methyltransferase family protein [Mesorhizobium sp. ISC11]|uniref:methyltransferase family protein n=1 Tax=Mesorhizobium sp. ISC11 TaxID=3076428 RepID=UPI00301D6D34